MERKIMMYLMNDNTLTIRANSLYEVLNVTKYNFDDWLDKILEYNFYLQKDYFYIDDIKEIVFSLDMAKTICIIHKSDDGIETLKLIKSMIDNPNRFIQAYHDYEKLNEKEKEEDKKIFIKEIPIGNVQDVIFDIINFCINQAEKNKKE